MSHPALQCNTSGDEPSDSLLDLQDSPTVGRVEASCDTAPNSVARSKISSANLTVSIPTPGALKAQRKPTTPSPLHTSVAVSPPTSASPHQSTFPSATTLSPIATPVNRILQEPLSKSPSPVESFGRSFTSDSFHSKGNLSPPVTPASKTSGTKPAPQTPNDTRSPLEAIVRASLPAMASSSGSSPDDRYKTPVRMMSIDSALSNISSKKSHDGVAGPVDIANLIKAAGSPEAVIQYLLKEKQSQSQQNAQLWRLVDKQRAMILGLNKDLERALKDKEKYRKKLKEVLAAQDGQAKDHGVQSSGIMSRVDENNSRGRGATEVPASPSVESDSVRNSPVSMTMAPYPITPPADRAPNELVSTVRELLDPSRSMPKASDHALDHFDIEEQDRAADKAKKGTDVASDIAFNPTLPPSRNLPSEPPRGPVPKPPTSPKVDQSMSQFPPPSAPPPRKPPPAPLQLKKDVKVAAPTIPQEDDYDSESDYGSLLEVDEIPAPQLRGRRRTREEDDEARSIIAQEEAERRSLSKKQGSQKGTPKKSAFAPGQGPAPESPRTAGGQTALRGDNIASLAGVLGGNQEQTLLTAPLVSPGLPASPRPINGKAPVPAQLSPPGMGGANAPLSPRPPRQPIPLPTSSQSGASSAEPLNMVRKASEPAAPSPTGSRDTPTERTRVYKGFKTEEYPDLLLPPNALPSIEVRVASSRMKPSRASLIALTQLEEDPVFTLAVFSRMDSGELWRVEKDTASLSKLDQRMKQCPAFTARTPDRSLFSGHAPAKLDARRIALNQYLDELLNAALDTTTALDLCKYLSTNVLPPNADDTGSAMESRSETPVQQTGPGARPTRSGYLTKRGKNFGGWKARFFVLDGPHLKYYETPGGAHLGTIKLQNAQIGKQAQQNPDGSPAPASANDELDNQYRHAFLILEPKKKDSTAHVKHVLCAESDHERDQWVDALLRWIDYRDGEDDSPHSGTSHDRHTSSHTSTNSLNAKKKMYAQARAQAQAQAQAGPGSQVPPSASQDNLIGISYEGTKQGDLPEGAPGHRKDSATLEQAPPSYVISAPRDPQVISDSSSWGSKGSLTIPGPSSEEKKQRKRSFFGFGSKSRNSSDDQDPTSNSGGAPAGGPSGGPRPVFGAPLAEAVRLHGPTDVHVPLPSVVYRCIQYLEVKNAIQEEGIFRLSGSNVVIKQLRERFNNEGDVNLVTDETYYDIHAVASLLKLYLRELPTTILTRELHLRFLQVTEMSGHKEKIAALAELVQLLPQANGTLLRYLIAFLIKIINHSDMNKMTVRNVGIVFSPTLNIPAPVFALLLQNYEGVFGMDPEEYELPSPVSETDSSAPTEPQLRRPATASATGSPSPYRQRLMEQARSTPTPPPLSSTGIRTTHVPSTSVPAVAVRPAGYEPPYLTHQYASSQSSLQPGYQSTSRLSPTSSHYSHDQDYSDVEQSYTSKSKRRESSMFMGNLVNVNQKPSQPSLTGLREEDQI